MIPENDDVIEKDDKDSKDDKDDKDAKLSDITEGRF